MASSNNLIAASAETWAFRTAFDNAWISDAFARDAEVLTNALKNSICNTNAVPGDVSYSDFFKSETPTSQYQTQSVSSSGGGGGGGGGAGSESETVSKRSTFRNAVSTPSGKISKRKSRASKRSPTTFITADPENFRQMVQQVTGVRFGSGSGGVGSVLKPEPQRPVGVVNRLQTGCLLPTLDTSAFLLDHHQQQVVGPSNVDFGPPPVVAQAGGSGFDFDGFSGFPTLESWN